LADEPTGSLDKKSSENLGRLLVELNREEGVALITVTHSMDLARLMNKIYSLQNGKLELAS
jgi:ABC-type lipoprotein export system ATPase subunit